MMNKIQKFRSLEEKILLLHQMGKDKPLSIAKILQLLSGKEYPLILIFLSLPFCQPIQIPGLSTPFGLIIAFIGLRMTFGKKVWLPRKLLEKNIPGDSLKRITNKALNLIQKTKPWIHPRFLRLCHSPFMKKGNGLIIFTLGILLALPLPIPLSNLTSAWSILLVSLGILGDDGLFVLIGYFVSLLTFVFFLVVLLTLKMFFTFSSNI